MSTQTTAQRRLLSSGARVSPARRVAIVTLLGWISLTAVGSTGANAQSATVPLPIVPPSAAPVPAPPPPSVQSAAANQAGPAPSVLGTQTATSTTPPAKVLGVSIVAPAQISPAFTGSNVDGPVRIALALTVAGSAMVVATRRRRAS